MYLSNLQKVSSERKNNQLQKSMVEKLTSLHMCCIGKDCVQLGAQLNSMGRHRSKVQGQEAIVDES